MKLEFFLQEDELIIHLPPKVDTSNVEEVSNAVYEIINSQTFVKLKLDATNLDYISSVGLRLILKLKKTYENLTIINVKSEVYEVFEMTGFTQIISIQKTLREVSIEGCQLIGKGAYGKVYRLTPDTIVKSFYKGNPIEDIDRERSIAKRAFVLGIPTAISYDIVKVKEEKYGSIYELIASDNLSDAIQKYPSKYNELISMYADLLLKINKTEDVRHEMVSFKKDYFKRLGYIKPYINDKTYQKIFKLINDTDEVDTLIHGDCHFKNVFVVGNELVLIDMDTLARGSELIELASLYRTYICYNIIDPGNTLKFFEIDEDTCVRVFNDTFALVTKDKNNKEEIINKLQFLGYFMLAAHYAHKDASQTDKINRCIDKFTEVIDKVNDLTY